MSTGQLPCHASPLSNPNTAALDALLERVERRLGDLLDREAERWCRLDPDLELGFRLLSDFIASGGKRLRPRFCLLGFLGIEGFEGPGSPAHGSRSGKRAEGTLHAAVDLAAAIEMLHTFALVHDDVMDGSPTRRHAPTVHASLAQVHQRDGWRGEQRRVSEGMAVLIGDLAFVYADRLMADMPRPVVDTFDEMRIELHVGQYLDMLGAATSASTPGRADRVIRYKTAAYSVERPLHLGAALAGGLEPRRAELSRYGLAVGDAFQLRDDVLGLFGDPSDTGKPSDDDLREGKATLLIELTRTWAGTTGDREVLEALSRLGAPDLSVAEADAVRAAVVASDALDLVERRIGVRVDDALDSLARLDVDPAVADELAELARFCAWRTA